MTIKAKKSKINLREKLAELLNFRQIRDRLDGLGLYLGKDRTGSAENLAVRGGANVDDLQLAEISAAVGGTAVDVFVYDTRNDSDGGKWRERTGHTSWYNEDLNTATRGGRREFPAVAVIVAEAGKITIYDGDDPNLSMWMVFEATQSGYTTILRSGNITSVSMLNGEFWVSHQSGSGVHWINFLKDTARWITASNGYGGYFKAGTIDKRNTSTVGNYDNDVAGASNIIIAHSDCNDVAMTVLPNAPIDDDTGLPVPTIAVACGNSSNGGFSIINHDGTVANKSYTESTINQSVSFTSDNRLVVSQKRNSNGDVWVAIYDDLTTSTSINGIIVHDGNISVKYNDINYLHLPNILSGTTGTIGNKYIMSDSGLTLFDQYESYIGYYVDDNPVNIHGMAAYTTSSYNTGWMPGDIKLAALSDTKIEKVGVDETTELVTNSEFAADSDWTKEAGWSIPGNGTAVASGASSTLYQIVDGLTIGQTYKISINVLSVTSGSVSYRAASISQDGNLDIHNFATDTGIREIVFKADTTSILIGAYGADSFSGTIGSLSLTQTGELITNGKFDNETEGWSAASNWTISGGVATTSAINTSSASDRFLTQGNALTIGQKYTLYMTITSADARAADTIFRIYNGTTYEDIFTLEPSTSYPVSFSYTFVAAGEDFILSTSAASGGQEDFSIDNISVRLAENDRSVNDNGLQIFGQIDKAPVAPGADLIAYSGFSADNYLMQPYNSDLDFGTGDFCVSFWFNYSSGGWENLFCLGNTSFTGSLSDAVICQLETSADRMTIYINNQTVGWIDTGLADNIWNHYTFKRKGGNVYQFLNGKLKITGTDNYNITGYGKTDWGLRLGHDGYNNSNVADGSKLALFRISATAPTDAQISKIYRDEKALFQDGAQATLYGTSDAVTALAYDDKTELLHVGTSDGRSDFAGLRRINNTTIPVTTSISASNNLIAEQ